MKGFRGSDITKRLPKYSTLKVQEVDLQSGTLYHGPYVGYSDDELTEIIDEQFLRHPFLHFAEMNRIKLPLEWRASICNGALIHFRGVDQELKLPPGTAARLLIDAAQRYQLKPEMQTPNTVRFEAEEPQGRAPDDPTAPSGKQGEK